MWYVGPLFNLGWNPRICPHLTSWRGPSHHLFGLGFGKLQPYMEFSTVWNHNSWTVLEEEKRGEIEERTPFLLPAMFLFYQVSGKRIKTKSMVSSFLLLLPFSTFITQLRFPRKMFSSTIIVKCLFLGANEKCFGEWCILGGQVIISICTELVLSHNREVMNKNQYQKKCRNNISSLCHAIDTFF